MIAMSTTILGFIIAMFIRPSKDKNLEEAAIDDLDEMEKGIGSNSVDTDFDDNTILDGEEVIAGTDGVITNPLNADADEYFVKEA
jgi:hypothetical protein